MIDYKDEILSFYYEKRQNFIEAADGPNNELGSAYTKQVELERLDRRGNVIDRFILHEAWCKKIEYDDFGDGSSDANMEKLTICYTYYERV